MKQPAAGEMRAKCPLVTECNTKPHDVADGNCCRASGQVTTATPHASAMLLDAGQGKSVITANIEVHVADGANSLANHSVLIKLVVFDDAHEMRRHIV